MEISKGLQQEIQSVQNKLKNAIRDHQICVGKLKDDPNNADILKRIQEIQLHIISLGRCQKQVVERLRKEVDEFKAVSANEVKVSVATLLGINNNNHITANNETNNDEINEVKVLPNGLDNLRISDAKDDYEEIVRNGDVSSSPRNNNIKKERSISVETVSADDQEIIEVSVNNETREKKRQQSEEPLEERKIKCTEQLSFLEVLGLITTLRSTELENKRAERKRRNTGNPQFVCSNWEMPTKRKRHNYLQSAGNFPQTRQTTARLNGPSPPPISNKSTTSIVPPKSTSPSSQKISKSLIPTQKATSRPNILRNMSESRVFPNKTNRIENGNGQSHSSSSSTRTSQSTPNSETVHIPGLPSGLTIERIENDTAVCINCRNPGTLTNCDNCEANYHVSCHSVSPPPPRLCPKCAQKMKHSTGTIKKNDELAAASYAPGVVGKAGQDPEINKASGGFYKIGTNTNQQQQIIAKSRGVNKLSGTTFLIPITSNAITTAVDIVQSEGIFTNESSSLNILESNRNSNDTIASSKIISATENLSYSRSIVIGNQLSRSNVTYVPQPDNTAIPFAYKLPIFDSQSSNEQQQQQQHQPRPFFYVQRLTKSPFETFHENRKAGESQNHPLNERTNVRDDSYEAGNTRNEIIDTTKHTETLTEPIIAGRTYKKSSTTRAIPGLTRIVSSIEKFTPITFDNRNNDNMDELQKFSYNGRGTTIRDQRQNETRYDESTGNKRGDFSITDRGRKFDGAAGSGGAGRGGGGGGGAGGGGKNEYTSESLFSRGKYRPVGIFHSLFSGYKKSDNIVDRTDKYEASTSSMFVQNDGIARNNDFTRNSTERTEQHCSNIATFTEYVKLEEAHLSAPSRAELIENENAYGTLSLRDENYPRKLQFSGRDLPLRRRTTEDRPFHFRTEEKQERRQLPRILMRMERKSIESRIPVDDYEMENYNHSSFERKYSNSFVRLPLDVKKMPDVKELPDVRELPDVTEFSEMNKISEMKKIMETESENDTSATEDALSPISNVERAARRKIDEAAKIDESKDLTSGKSEINDEVKSRDELVIDEETDDNEEEIDDEEDQDCPIIDQEIRDETDKEFRIGTVSPESMRVLEQFESAMLQVDSGDKTANP